MPDYTQMEILRTVVTKVNIDNVVIYSVSELNHNLFNRLFFFIILLFLLYQTHITICLLTKGNPCL